MFSAFIALIRGEFSHLLNTVGHAVLAGAEALLESIATNGGELLITAATDAVIAAEQKGGSGSEKLAAAQASVVADLTAKGIPVVLNAVNGAIEAAVASMKATPAVATTEAN